MIEHAGQLSSGADNTGPSRTDSSAGRPESLDHDGDDPAQPLNNGHRNEVTLIGRLASDVRERSMPSGALLSSFRLVVRRDSVVHGPNIDALDCIAWRAPVQRAVRRWAAGDLVEVRGAVRRRFWRGVSGSVSRCEIEVTVVRRLARAAAGVSGGRRGARAAPHATHTPVDAAKDASVSAPVHQRAGPLPSVMSSA